MKVKYIDDVIIVYLKDVFEDDSYKLSKDISDKLNKYYMIELKGFYKVNVYIDSNYGTILEYINEGKNLDFKFTKLDLNLNVYKEKFLYEINDIFYYKINKIIFFDNRYYIDKYISELEISNIIFKNIDIIKKYGIEKLLK